MRKTSAAGSRSVVVAFIIFSHALSANNNNTAVAEKYYVSTMNFVGRPVGCRRRRRTKTLPKIVTVNPADERICQPPCTYDGRI